MAVYTRKLTDSKTPDGRNHDVEHIKPLADGGTNDVGNIRPMEHGDHVAHHSGNGDYRRWGGRGRRQ
jgi:hypothetical protein